MPEAKVQAVKFKNFTDRDFSWKYNGVEYSFKAGEETYLEDFKAQHFAKHLIDRELTLQSPPNQSLTGNKTKRAEMEKLCFPTSETVSAERALDMQARKDEEKPVAEKDEEFPDLTKN